MSNTQRAFWCGLLGVLFMLTLCAMMGAAQSFRSEQVKQKCDLIGMIELQGEAYICIKVPKGEHQ